ncbi:phosphoribosyltransferase [Micromonospora sp. NPDC051925]|uniref:phosphoribosyltransferase n=1 Tax=Micromonospora sp. NPDC051925 TaxID=3364288 RepID=UPI0037C9C202
MVTSRTFLGAQTWAMPRGAFASAAALIAQAEAPHAPEVAVGIERGGRELASRVAGLLNIPAAFVPARHNDSDQVGIQASGRVRVEARAIEQLPTAGRLLLLDDICGSGATLRTLIAVITGLRAPTSIRTAVLCRNVGAGFTPDSWVWDVSDWVCFPWEDQPTHRTEPLPAPRLVHHP